MNYSAIKDMLLVGFLAMLFAAPVYGQNVVINEFMASNGDTIADDDEDFEDWIELYNASESAVNLEGWGISDDLSRPFRWVFPSITIEPGEYLLVWASGKDRYYGSITKEKPLVESWSEWLYLDDGSDQGTVWRQPDFDDTAWASGAAPLGYGPLDNYVVTTVNYGGDSNNKYITTYFRKHFEVSVDIEHIESLRLSLWLDDGAVVYLNGVELVRELMPDGEINYLTPAATYVAQWPSWTHYEVPADALLEGTNVLAVEVHQVSGTSSDLAFDLRLVSDVPATSLHTNFSISADGEPLTLTRPDGSVADAIEPIELIRDVSYGRAADGGDEWVYFVDSTPGQSNNAAVGYQGIMPTPEFSHVSGFFEDSFNLTVSGGPPGAVIRYSLNGSEPTAASPVYSGPLQIASRAGQANTISMIRTADSWLAPQGEVFKGTVVRARLFGDNFIPGLTKTATYFVGPGVPNRHQLPVISLATTAANFFNSGYGIYVPYNFLERGPEWERPVHVTMFEPDGSIVLNQDAGIRIHGGWTRNLPQKGLRLYARSGYGQGEFDYPVFSGFEREVFKRLLLRNSGNDNAQTFFRDAMMQRLIEHLPIDMQAYRPAVVYLNGEYWGIHNIRERVDKYYLHYKYGVDPEALDILEFRAHIEGALVKQGDTAHYNQMLDYIEAHGLSNPAHYAHVQTLMDTDNFIDNNICHIYFNNTDWPGNNNDWWRLRTDAYDPDAPPGHDGRWRWFLFDTDFGFGHSGGYTSNTLSFATAVTSNWNNPHWATYLLRKLLENDTFRRDFINRYADLLNTAFLSERVVAVIDEMQDAIAAEMPEHIARWRRPGSIAGWNNQVQVMRTFANQRPDYARTHLRNHFGLQSDRLLTLDVSDAEYGFIRVNRTDINADTPGVNSAAPYPWTGTYFRFHPITVTAIPHHAHRFSHWMGSPTGMDPFAPTLSLPMSGNVSLTAVFEAPALIHYWHFNDLPGGILTTASADYSVAQSAQITYPGVGDGYLDTTDGSDLNARLGQDAGKCLRVRNPSDTRQLLLTLPTTGYEAVQLSYVVMRTTNGAQTQTVEYRTSSTGDWQPIGHLTVPEDYELFTFDFSDIPGADDNPEFAVRILFGGDNASGTSGNNRFDNITLEAMPLAGTNQPPKLIAALPFRRMIEATPITINLDNFFADPDGDELLYTVLSSNPDAIATAVDGGLLTLTPLYRGDSVIRVQAEDGVNPPMQVSFRVLVYPRTHTLREQAFVFDHWAANEPELTFPDHMLFVQSDTSDPGLNAPLDYAYFIPHDGDDGYHSNDEHIIGYPYMTTGRSRINGLDEDGIAFINTGRDRDLGGAILALDTTGVESAEVRWLNETLARNVRDYAIRLQYRIGHTGSFIDLTDGGSPVEYPAQADGHTQAFGPIQLPSAAMGRPYVQLLWRYYHVHGSSGSRPQLRLDDISVSQSYYPYQNQAHTIPGRIQAERFDVGGQGISYYDTTEGNSGGAFRSNVNVDIVSIIDDVSGFAITDIEDGEWLRYTVNSTASAMEVYARVAAIQDGGQILVWLDDELIATLDVPNTGSLTTWQTVMTHAQPLPDREKATVRLEFVGSGFRLNWFDFQNRRPYLGTPHQVPGRIQFEDYDIGGQQISYFDKTATNGYGAYRPQEPVDIMGITDEGVTGFAVYAMNGEWLEYTCSIEPGLYTVVVRSSSPFGAQQLVLSEGQRTAAVIALPSTGGWMNWQSTAVSSVYLTGGENQVLRLHLQTSTALLHYIEFIPEYQPSFPYGDQPHEIPGRIQAERFDIGGQGAAYFDTTAGNSGGAFRPDEDVDIVSITDVGSGFAITDIEDGEWLVYTVNSAPGQTRIHARVASVQDGAQILVRLDDDWAATIDVPNTGSLTTWQTVTVNCPSLPDRENAKLRLEFAGSGFRLNWIDFTNQQPYLGVPHALPGRIQFEDYDLGGPLIAYYDTTTLNGYGAYRPNEGVDIMGITDEGTPGYAVYAVAGEWLEYTSSIKPGFYTVVVRSSSAFGAQQLVLYEGQRTAATFTLPSTGGWSNWSNTAVSNVYLAGGENQILRFRLQTSTAQLHYVELIRDRNPADITGSGRVDMDDFAILAAQWLGAAGTPSADIAPLPDGDGVVDLLDLLMLFENWLADE